MHRVFLLCTLIVLLSVSADADPKLTITNVTAFGTNPSFVSGTVSGVDPGEYIVAPFIFLPGMGWYSKPYCDASGPYTRFVEINPNGSWSARITTGGVDHYATMVEAYLIKKTDFPGCYPSCVLGAGSLPDTVKSCAAASDRIFRPGQRIIEWSGKNWAVRNSGGALAGPGSNRFSDSTDNVWVDDEGRLHLKIRKNASNQWVSAEIISLDRPGYGTYRFYLDSRVDNLDRNAVLGLFTWSSFSSFNNAYREIDIEFSRWGDPAGQNSQYVVQPWDTPGNRYRFNTPAYEKSTHVFTWEPEQISFMSAEGHCQGEECQPFAEWTYSRTEQVPPSLDERVHLNLWLNSSAPSDGNPVEVIISRFEFEPFVPSDRSVCGISISALRHPVAETAAQNYQFRVWGRVLDKDCNSLLITDGSRGTLGQMLPVRVLEPGQTYGIGDFISAEGDREAGDPVMIDTAMGRTSRLD